MDDNPRKGPRANHRTWHVTLTNGRRLSVSGTKAVISTSGALVILGDAHGHHPRHVFSPHGWAECHDAKAIDEAAIVEESRTGTG